MGVPESSWGIIQSFLHNRQMQFKVGNSLSTSRLLRGGAPQGTLLGNFLFILATNDLEKRDDGNTTVEPSESSGSTQSVEEDEGAFTESSDNESPTLATYGTSTPARPGPLNDPASPTTEDESFSYFSEFRRPHNRIEDTHDNITIHTLDGSAMMRNQPPKGNWTKRRDSSLKYVDQLNTSR